MSDPDNLSTTFLLMSFFRLVRALWLSSVFVFSANSCSISSRDLEQLRWDTCSSSRQIAVVDSRRINWKDVRDGDLQAFLKETSSLAVPDYSIISIGSKNLKLLNFGGLNVIKGPTSARLRIVDSSVETIDFSLLDIEIPLEIRQNKWLREVAFGEGRPYIIYEVSNNPSLCDQSFNEFLKIQSIQPPIKNCDRFCWDLADLENKRSCYVLKSDLIVDQYGRIPQLYKVAHIEGRVLIHWNDDFTDVSETFQYLRTIEYNGIGNALALIHNPNLAKFTFPSLEKVTGGTGKRIVIKRNQRPMHEWEKKRLMEQTGLEEKDVDIQTTGDWPREEPHDETDPIEISPNQSSAREGQRPGSSARAIIGGVVLFLIVVGSIVFTIYWIVVSLKRPPKEETIEDPAEGKESPQKTTVRGRTAAPFSSPATTTTTASRAVPFTEEKTEENSSPVASTNEEVPITTPAVPPLSFAQNVVSLAPKPPVMPSYTVLAPPPKALQPKASPTGTPPTLPATAGAVAMPPKKSLLPPFVLM